MKKHFVDFKITKKRIAKKRAKVEHQITKLLSYYSKDFVGYEAFVLDD